MTQSILTKILRYKADGNTVEMVNKKLNLVYGNVYCYQKEDKESYGDQIRYDYYILSDSKEFAYPLSESEYRKPEEIIEYLKAQDFNQAKIIEFFKKSLDKGSYLNKRDILFAKLCKEYDLAEKMLIAHDEYIKRANEKREQERIESEEAERKRNEEEERKKAQQLQSAYEKIKSEKWITVEEFEMLCNAENIKLPAKFVGWLRERCGNICIKKHKEQLGENLYWEHLYNTCYYCNKKYKSTAIYRYADALGTAIGL